MLEGLHLEARRGRRVLFTGLSFQAPPGRLLRVAGTNGAGKTTLLRTAVGLSTANAGTVHWQGQPITAQRDEFHRALVYIGHASALKDGLTALENLRTLCAVAGSPVSAARAAEALAEAGLRGREQLPARVLSQGQRRRVGLAQLALADDRPLWVLDEPFNALDDSAAQWLGGLVQAHLGRGGIVVLTSHQAVPLSTIDPLVLTL